MYQVTANAGYKSKPMTYDAAQQYAEQLKQLGNYDVKVVKA